MFSLDSGLILIVSILIVGYAIIKINRYFLLRYSQVRQGLEDLKVQVSDLEDKLNNLEKQNKRLQQDSERIISLYDMSRELAKYLDEDKLLNIFNENAHKYLNFVDCILIGESHLNREDLVDYQIIELAIQNEIVGFLAVKGLSDSDKTDFNILCSQFALALKKVKLYEEIQQLAITDSLTNTYTRRYFLERAEEELHRSLKFDLSFSFIILDIDRFKDCNDKYGHLVGDVVLRELAELLRNSIRQIDLLGRFGGEEFCIVLPETNKSSAFQAAQRIRQSVIGAKIKAYDETINLTVSIGIANFPEDADNLRQLIDRSDWALYRAKQTGRDKISMYGVYK